MTVREAFSKAYGPVPEGATCHILSIEDTDEELCVVPMCRTPDGWVYVPKSETVDYATLGAEWEKNIWFRVWHPGKTDIADQPASAFVALLHEWPDFARVVMEADST